MTALAAERDTPQMGAAAAILLLAIPLAAATKVYRGGIVCVDITGYGKPAAAGLNLVAVGRAEETVDNTGSAGAKKVKVRRGTFQFTNGTGDEAITSVDVGRACYLVDDQTVGRTSQNGILSFAGRVLDVDSSGVWVELGVDADPTIVDLLLEAAADLSSSQFLFVEMNSSGDVTACNAAGEDAVGVLQNAPANGAIAIVRVHGTSRVIGSAAINPGVLLATTNAGKSKAAVAASTNTSDAGAASDALVGSFAMGRALTACAGDGSQHSMFVHPIGAIPTTAA
jgi:hypothetical protein